MPPATTISLSWEVDNFMRNMAPVQIISKGLFFDWKQTNYCAENRRLEDNLWICTNSMIYCAVPWGRGLGKGNQITQLWLKFLFARYIIDTEWVADGLWCMIVNHKPKIVEVSIVGGYK